ncbi:ATP synthase F0 subunit C [Candidatus Babeliales bacterium]|nr:ATP synthase F0 subunit C [Candidatus Babeliales bacterium]MBP9844272.1 ATP synthase F0 subunit C [Candidatus Babeliales bacterium]
MDANYSTYAQAAAFLGAAIVMGVGSIGPALGQGMIGKAACDAVGRNPESGSKMRMMMLIAMGMVETSAIYALIIAILLIMYNLPVAA